MLVITCHLIWYITCEKLCCVGGVYHPQYRKLAISLVINCSHFLSSDNLLEIVQYTRFVRVIHCTITTTRKNSQVLKSIDPSIPPNCEITFPGNISIVPKHAQPSNDLKLLKWHQVPRSMRGCLLFSCPYRSSTTRFKNVWFLVATLFLHCVVNIESYVWFIAFLFFLLLQKSQKIVLWKIYFDLDQVLKLVGLSNFYYLTRAYLLQYFTLKKYCMIQYTFIILFKIFF